MNSFWLQFAISEAVAIAQAVVMSNTSLTPQQKTALENFIAAAAAVGAVV